MRYQYRPLNASQQLEKNSMAYTLRDVLAVPLGPNLGDAYDNGAVAGHG
jgi:hypothetical protein